MQSCVLIPALSCQPKFIGCLLKQLKPDSPVIVQSPGPGQQQTQGRGYMIRGIPNIHTAGRRGHDYRDPEGGDWKERLQEVSTPN